jgi:hypothetical protein
LFSAAKRWVFGSGSASPTLLTAIVRITNGVLKMISKPTLMDQRITLKRTANLLGKNQPAG